MLWSKYTPNRNFGPSETFKLENNDDTKPNFLLIENRRTFCDIIEIFIPPQIFRNKNVNYQTLSIFLIKCIYNNISDDSNYLSYTNENRLA